MENIYRTTPLDKIPWNMETPPDILKSFLSANVEKHARVIELGCGAGNYVIYLAREGFSAAGVDISETAIEIARKSAAEQKADCNFYAADVLGNLEEISPAFDFAYDWELLHHIFPEDREKYVGNVHRLLKPAGRYLSVCFSEASDQFGGEGKYRTTPINTVLYFSSEEEMISLFEPLFKIRELKTVQITGKYAPHKAICADMLKM